MKLVRLFLMSGLAFVAFSGVATAAEGPPPLSVPLGVTVVSTTVSPEGKWSTYSNGMRLFEPASPDSIGECEPQWFCLWEQHQFRR
jgi:hypothetical protein